MNLLDTELFEETKEQNIKKGYTTEQFIEKAKLVHGDRYDYSNVKYTNSITAVEILCRKHGIFLQKPVYHLGGSGCMKCRNENISLRKNKGIDFFIKKANSIHGDKYDYSKSIYKHTEEKLEIICKIHGSFWQTPHDHLSDHGCPDCAIEYRNKNNTYTIEEFIEKAKAVHGDKYDYSQTNYVGYKNKLKINCFKHGIFEQTPNDHLNGSGCCKCGKEKSSQKNILSKEEFIEKAKLVHGDRYDYSVSKYVRSLEKMDIGCTVHGIFSQRPNDHLNGRGCAKCSNQGISNEEKELLYFIRQNYDGEVVENSRSIIDGYELDIYVPELKLAIEYNGLFWHSERYKDKNYHLNKTNLCEEKGIHLIHIYEDDWYNKNDVIRSRIINLLKKSTKHIYARKCEIREVDNKTSKDFLIENHLQGKIYGVLNIGLYYEDELVSLMVFGNLRKNLGNVAREGSYELLRFVNKKYVTVVGGATKLFSYFIKKYKPTNVISYADRSWTMNNNKTIYDTLGFKKSGMTQVNYFYIIDGVRKNRFGYRKDLLIKEGFDGSKTEHQIMLDREIYRIYDCGCLKYVY